MWVDNLKRIRRFLRDPNGNIWSDSIIKNQFNVSQKNLQRKTNILDEVEPVHVPPRYDYTYLQDWEWPFLSSETGNYQAFRMHQQAEIVFCYRWEPQTVWGLIAETAVEEGTHFTHPFEAFMGVTPGDIVPLQYPSGFHNAKFVAWDKEPIDYITLKSIQQDDPSWASRTGEPFAYWRPDRLENQFCLYPIPSTVVWEDVQESLSIPEYDYIYSFTWEYTGAYITGTGANFTREDSTDSVQYIHDWELEIGEYVDNVVMRGMWQYELPIDITCAIGGIIYTDSATETSETGLIADIGDIVIGGETGITADVIEASNNVLFVYSKEPKDIVDVTDESDFPDYLQKYAEYGTLELCYGADTDGKIQSLRDYWKQRSDVGIKAIEKYKSMRKQDRDYRMITHGVPGFRTRRQPRLPDEYPAVR